MKSTIIKSNDIYDIERCIDGDEDFKSVLLLIDIDDVVFKLKCSNGTDLNENFRNQLSILTDFDYFRNDSKGNFASYCNEHYLALMKGYYQELSTCKTELLQGPLTSGTIKRLMRDPGVMVRFFTGRSLEAAKDTKNQLNRYGLYRDHFCEEVIPLSFLTAGRSGNVIYCAGRPKGEILKRLHQNMSILSNGYYNKVIFIDDSLYNLKSVEKVLKESGYCNEFIGLHYNLDFKNEKLKELFSKDNEEILKECTNNDGRKISEGKTPLELVPLEFLEYFVPALQCGVEKGYRKDNWKEVDINHKSSKKLAAATRHLIDYQKGQRGDSGDYIEYHNGKEIPSNHLSAALFNIAWIIYGLRHHGITEDDRDA